MNVEALASGVPVISTDWGGSRELIKNGYNGYLLKVLREKHNSKHRIVNKELETLIIKLLIDQDLNMSLRKNASESVKGFDYHEVFPQLISLLTKRKTSKPQKSHWVSLKEKLILDFSDHFTKDMLFFLYYQPNFRIDTYEALYNWVVGNDIDSMKGLMTKSFTGTADVSDYNKANVSNENKRTSAMRNDLINIFHPL